MSADLEKAIESLEELVGTLNWSSDLLDNDECETILDKVKGLEIYVTQHVL